MWENGPPYFNGPRKNEACESGVRPIRTNISRVVIEIVFN